MTGERPDEVRRSTLVVWLVVIAAAAIALAVWRNRPDADVDGRAAGRDGEVTLALTGDTVVTRALAELEADAGFTPVVRLLRGASLAVTNLEMTLFQRPPTGSWGPGAWPFGTATDAATLQRIGFDVVTRAHNRAFDYGADGLEQTGAVLDAAGLRHAGAGRNLAGSRAALTIEAAKTPVAFFSVTVSSSAESRATDARGEIAGRPGINPLKFSANITVDEQTFATLKASAPSLQADAVVGEQELTLFGRSIRKGEKTVVTFTLDETDEAAILDGIAAARRVAPIVVVALHSHEPSNHSDQPAGFVREFAVRAIERGAAIVAGHGPHQLRGIEVVAGGVIFHSLGNFLYPYEPLATRDADLFDGGLDLYGLALGAIDARERRTPAPMDRSEWWESVVAEAAFSDGVLTGVRLYPIDLGTDRAPERRGTPRLATGARASAILSRVAQLSAPFKTSMEVRDEVGIVKVDPRVP